MAVRLRFGREERTWLTTMRTPGDDTALAVGLLYAEGLIAGREDLVRVVEGCPQGGDGHQVSVELARAVSFVPRPVAATAACGICGRQTIDDLLARPLPDLPAGPLLEAGVLEVLPDRLLEAQRAHRRTGGLHAAGWFTAAGEMLGAAEDVGRHNAVDKVIGAALLAGELPVGETVLVVTGRFGYELAVKARVAGFPVVVAVGAPSALAVALAEAAGMTICGFAAPGRLNVYTAPERVSDLPR